jgi:hypothetical protein
MRKRKEEEKEKEKKGATSALRACNFVPIGNTHRQKILI